MAIRPFKWERPTQKDIEGMRSNKTMKYFIIGLIVGILCNFRIAIKR